MKQRYSAVTWRINKTDWWTFKIFTVHLNASVTRICVFSAWNSKIQGQSLFYSAWLFNYQIFITWILNSRKCCYTQNGVFPFFTVCFPFLDLSYFIIFFKDISNYLKGFFRMMALFSLSVISSVCLISTEIKFEQLESPSPF